MSEWIQNKWEAFKFLFAYKIVSTATQLYLGSLIATNGSSETPFLNLRTIAHMGAVVVTLRALDALFDPVLQKVTPPELKQIAGETTKIEEVKPNTNS